MAQVNGNVGRQGGGFTGIGSPPVYALGSSPAGLTAPTLPNTGTSWNFGTAINNLTVQIATTGSPTFSVQPQGSLDGKTWSNLGAAITSSGLTTLTNVCVPWVQLNLTALSGGSITGLVCGN